MPLSGYTVLAVDDYEPHNYALARTLEHAHSNVLRAFTGWQAIRLASQRPDLILMDVNLPDINGFEVCRRLKNDPETSSIPVVFVSATHRDSVAKADGENAGANGFLFYPVEPEQLYAVILGAIARSRE